MTEVHKVVGTETEFGITIRNQPDFNPVLASSLVINSYAGTSTRIPWSFDEESPGRDARGFGYDPAPTGEFESGLVNVVLTNGARFYVDHAHPEYSSPECFDALEAALHDKAGEVVLERAAAAANRTLPEGQRLFVHKNNSDGKGNSYGAHENYLVSRTVPFGELVRHLTGFFASRQIFTGSGKVGAENGRPPVAYQITQRADFFEEEVGLETTLKRPIINTRDEPHADPGRYRRLHVIIGDANRSEVQTFLKLGTTALILAALEAGNLGDPIALAHPVDAVWRISHDPTLRVAVELVDGQTATALDLQWQYLGWVSKHAEVHGVSDVELRVIDTWEEVLTDLERDPDSTADRLDWTAKLAILEGYRRRDRLGWDAPKIRLADLQYHDVDSTRSLYRRLVDGGRMQRLFTDAEVLRATTEPPERTRAWFRGACIERYGSAIVAANWDSLIFDVGEDALKRVPMMEPLRGGKDRVAALLARSPTPADLVRALAGEEGGEHGRAGAQTDPQG
ncbi:MAG: proteasome accessory factor PafA2 [Actinobacteria bacterium RBG_16_68_21]|nr:MAG: proteasome accessory factor PafA2 [Actinobacteria bacterium RBG_16_68_21]